jgi:hypothetical protein
VVVVAVVVDPVVPGSVVDGVTGVVVGVVETVTVNSIDP